MRHSSSIFTPCWLALAGLAAATGSAPSQDQPPELVASTEARTPEAERAGFHLPPGFEAQLVVSEPDIDKPMNMAFDDRGRLWVTVTREYPYPAEEGSTPRDRVLILDEFGPDGRPGKITTFADGLNIPIGVWPIGEGNRALVYSIPDIYLMTDDDGDGRADRREVAYGTFGFRDTHGMSSSYTPGFDGWIYATHGFSNTSTVKAENGEPITMNSGNTYRMREDGSRIEQRTWGQVNPFGLAFDPLGNLYSADCHSRPIYQLLPGAYYPSFGKPDDGLGYGPEMMQHDHNSTGISGIAVLATDSVPEDLRGDILIGNVVTSRINRDRVDWHGSSPKAVAEPDFLVSDDPWFRPVDVEVGPDGAIYVADFYNRIIGHYEVPLTHPGRDRTSGRIWRIVYRGDDAKSTPAPRGGDFASATTEELVEALSHPNLTVRMRATWVLARRGDEAARAVRNSLDRPANAWAEAHALWVLERLGKLDETTLAAGSRGEDALVRVHAMRILTDRANLDEPEHERAVEALRDADAHVRRAAAQVLGAHPKAENLRPLLDAREAADPADSHLVHVIRMALRDQLRGGAGWPKVSDDSWSEADLRALVDVANGVASTDAARFQLAVLQKQGASPENLLRFEEHIARYGDPDLDREVVAYARSRQPDDPGQAAAQARAIYRGLQGRGAAMGDDLRGWALALSTGLLESQDDGRVALGAELAGEFRLTEAAVPLARLALLKSEPEGRRLSAVNALAAIAPEAVVAPLVTILDDPAESIGLRERASVLLGESGRPEGKEALSLSLTTAPARLQAPIALALANDQPGAARLLDLIEAGKASPRLLQAPAVDIRLRQLGVPDLATRLETLTSGLPPADQVIAERIASRQAGFAAASGRSAERGAAVFEKSCAACHQLGGKGARVGPQLDGIGARGSERLMEDILDPNRNVDQAFRASTLALDDGRVLTGLVLNDEGEVIVVADAQGKEVRVPKASVEDRRVAPLSPMPADLAEQIEEQDFYDLITYLLSHREPAAKPE